MSSLAQVERAIDGERPFRSLVRLLGIHRWRVLGAVTIFAIKESPLWLLPLVTAQVIDIVVANGPVETLLLWGIFAAVLLIQSYPGHVIYTRWFMGAVRDIGESLRRLLATKLHALSIGYYTHLGAPIVQTKVVRDVENFELALQLTITPFLSSVMVVIGSVVMTAVNVPEFLLLYVFAIPLAVILRQSLRRRVREYNASLRKEVGSFSTRVAEMATLMPITRAHGLEESAVSRVSAGAERVRNAAFTLDLLNGRFGSFTWVSLQLLNLACLIGVAYAAIADIVPRAGAGEVLLVATYFTLLTSHVAKLLVLLPEFARSGESIRSIAEVLREPDIETGENKETLDDVQGRISLHDVQYQYRAGEIVLDGVNLEVQPGETIAFVGPSGSGKSTLLNLMIGFLKPTRGRISVDGRDIENLDLRSYRRFVSVVPQESVLFEGTIRDNIAYGLSEQSDERILQALEAAKATDVLDALPDGLDTRITHGGSSLSAGQRQRLSIARALIRNPKVLFLDEATSALDYESEMKVQAALDTLMAGRTTLVVAHRLSTIRNADRIAVIDNGRIAEIGSHEDLLARDGRYAQLYRSSMM